MTVSEKRTIKRIILERVNESIALASKALIENNASSYHYSIGRQNGLVEAMAILDKISEKKWQKEEQ